MPHDSLAPLPPDTSDLPSAPTFGRAGGKELSRLEHDVSMARIEALSDPKKANALAVAEKRRELFLNEHDNAGAFKFKRFSRELLSSLDPRGERSGVLAVDEEGRFSVAPAARDRRMLFVNMGELDRVNKEGGGHDAGDAALTETVRSLEGIITRQLGKKSSAYTMLRYSGNEFMVSFDAVSAHDFDEIIRATRDLAPEVPGVDDPPPVVAEGFEFSETVDLLQQVQAELPLAERIDANDPFAVARELIEIVRKRADWSLDVSKFLSRVDRVQKKLREEGGEKTVPFFENYMRKTFKGTPLQDLLAFERLSKEEAERLAFDQASNRLRASAESSSVTRRIVESRVAEIRGRSGADQETRKRTSESGGARLATIPEMTDGQRKIADAEERARAAEEGGDGDAAELARLDAQIETARRDRGTGLLERGAHYEDLERALEEGKLPALVFVDMAFLRYFDNRGGVDVGNQALKLAAHLMERAIAESGVKGRAYRYGGDEFTVQLEGGEAEAAKFLRTLEIIRSGVGAVPPGQSGERDGYVPTELVFNVGVASADVLDGVFASLKDAGAYAPSDLANAGFVKNAKAELMTKIADRGIERQKAVNRFLFLIDAMHRNDMPAHQVEDLKTFSNKAIFAESGGTEFLQQLAASGKSEAELVPEIEAWVEKKSAEARKKEGERSELLTGLIEVHGKLAYYERALAEARHDSEVQRESYDRMAKELRLAREERRQLVDARKRIDEMDGEK